MSAENPLAERVRFNVLFEDVPDAVFNALKNHLKPRIVEEGTEREDLFLIASGRVKISRETQEGKEYLLALLHDGDFFGELGLIDGRASSAKVTALEDTVILSLHKSHFELLLNSSHPFANRLLTVLSIFLRALDQHFVAETERNAREARIELSKRERLIEAAKRLNSTLDLEKLLQIILDLALEMVHGDRGSVYIVDEKKNELWAKVAKGLAGNELVKINLPIGKGITGYVGATGDTINIPDAYLDPRFSPEFDKSTGYRTKSILCMPMKNQRGKIVGVFQLLNKLKGIFTKEDEVLIEGLSVHAALAIENARLYEQERQKILLERDLTAAREVQKSLIPKELPDIPGYEFAACSLPAKEVGGDLYDFHPVDDTKLALCLGDVSGKGLPASLVMANLLAILRSQSFRNFPVHEIIQQSNRQLHRYIGSDKFVTLFYGVLDTVHHQLVFTNAGQEQPFVLSRTASPKRLDAGGIPLGMLEEFPYVEDSVQLNPGDVLVISSDGVSEAMNAEGKQFGEERRAAILLDNQSVPSSALLQRIVTAVEEHVGGAQQSDDITIVVARRLPE
jgi:sigma-B regulation protein RsbU (phosphoserine phosphatase)